MNESRRVSRALCHAILRAASLIAPAQNRADWLEEWTAELAALEEADGAPGSISFALGSVRHAIWERRQEWTMDGVLQDLRFGARVLRRNPVFTLAAVATLALGIGSNAAVFSVVNGVLFKPIPGIVEPARVVQIGRSYSADRRFDTWSSPALRELSIGTGGILSNVSGYSRRAGILGRGVGAAQVGMELVTGSYFQALGVNPVMGRMIGPDDDRTPGAHPVVVLSHAAWSGRFGADPSIIGTTIQINSLPHEVIGVAPPGFVGVEKVGTPPSMWVPASQYGVLNATPALPFEDEQWSWLNVIARLAPGVAADRARVTLNGLARLLEADSPYWQDLEPRMGTGVGLDPEGKAEGRLIALLLMGLAAIVLLITCANVANLLLARATTRSNELGIRLAMGAGRVRLARQLTAESILLAAIGVLLSLPFAWSGALMRPTLFPNEVGVILDPDARVFAFAAVSGVLAVLLFGLAPAFGIAGRGRITGLRDARGVSSRGAGRVRKVLVIAQLALSLALVTAAGMLWTSLWNVRSADPGFDSTNLLAMNVTAGHLERYRGDDGHALYERLLDNVRRTPGVVAATEASAVPVADYQSSSTVRTGPVGGTGVRDFPADVIEIGSDYFSTLGVPLIRGVSFDQAGSGPAGPGEPLVIVSESLAAILWPGEDAIGKMLYRAEGARVVAIAADVHHRGVANRPRPTAYYPVRSRQAAPRSLDIIVRTATPPSGMVPAIGQAISATEPDLPISRTLDVRRAVTQSLTDTRTTAWLIGILATLALCMAAIGLFGILAFTVSRRGRELGIRSALGAEPGDLVRLVVREGLTLAAIGTLAGLLFAYIIGSAMRGLLFGVAPLHPPTFAVTATLLLAVALAAAWVPARRAGAVSVTDALREN